MSWKVSLVWPILAGIVAALAVVALLARSDLLGASSSWENVLGVAGFFLAGGGVGVGLANQDGPPQRWLPVSMGVTFAGITVSAVAYDSTLVAYLAVIGFASGLLLGNMCGNYWDQEPEPESRNPVIRDAAAAGRAMVEAAAKKAGQ